MDCLYFDHNATTPLLPQVRDAIWPYFTEHFGNPASLHQPGRRTRTAIETARAQVAALIGAEPEEIIFTAGGTESDNFALLGSLETLRPQGRHLITTSVEHLAVLDSCRYHERHGGSVSYLPVDASGQIDLAELEAAIRPDTVLISVMWANNETGVLFPIDAVAAVARRHGIRLHSDAVQALGKVPIDVRRTPVDLLSLSGHKIGAPKGVGALFVRRGTAISPYLHGGHQEGGLRAGTHHVAGIVGMGTACDWIRPRLSQENQRQRALLRQLEDGIRAAVPEVLRNGDPQSCLPNTLNLSFPQIEGEGLLLGLDLVGIAASSGSACTSGRAGASHVLSAMGVPGARLHSSVRLSLGYQTSEAEVAALLQRLPAVVGRLQSLSLPADVDLSLFDCPVIECLLADHD